MSNSYTLDQLRADLDKKFAPLEIDGAILRNVMRLSKDERKAVKDVMAEIGAASDTEDGDREDEVLAGILKLVETLVADPKRGKALVAGIGGDLALAMHVLESWTAATQSGEASDSPS